MDFENPLDEDGNNIYNLTLEVSVRDNLGTQPVGVMIDIALVINDTDDDPVPTFPSWWNDDAPDHWSYEENNAPVATISQVEVNGKTLAEMTLEEKSEISHRKKATIKMVELLNEI